jgi:hypothetical protein
VSSASTCAHKPRGPGALRPVTPPLLAQGDVTAANWRNYVARGGISDRRTKASADKTSSFTFDTIVLIAQRSVPIRSRSRMRFRKLSAGDIRAGLRVLPISFGPAHEDLASR